MKITGASGQALLSVIPLRACYAGYIAVQCTEVNLHTCKFIEMLISKFPEIANDAPTKIY